MLPTTAAEAWRALLQRDAFLHATYGMLGFRGAEEWPENFEEGQLVETQLLIFNFLPAWKHTLHVIKVDHDNMEIASRERGGLIRQWNHRKWIEGGSGAICKYTDEVDIDAGALTLFVWLFAHIFYRYRQRRMRLAAVRS